MSNHPFIKTFVSIFVGTLAVAAGLSVAGLLYESWTTVSCDVAHYSLTGDMTTTELDGVYETDGGIVDQTSSARLVRWIEASRDDDAIEAILLDVDSYGGLPVAGEEIAGALKNSGKPTVAVIHGGGASAAYWAASGADKIFASANSDVGGIGVILSYLDTVQQNEDQGLHYNVITSAKYKSLGDPNLTLSDDERTIIKRDVDIMHDNFVQAIAENRGLDLEKVKTLADGTTVLGAAALDAGLIDAIGDRAAALDYLAETLGHDVTLCDDPYVAPEETLW